MPLSIESYVSIIMLALSENDFVNKYSKMTRKTAVQVRDRIFNGKDALSIISFSQDFKVG